MMIINKKLLFLPLFLVVTYSLFFSCRKEPNRDALISENKPPIARAGNDTLIMLPVDSIVLNGTSSYDPDGSIEEYRWSKISGPPSLIIKNPGSATPVLQGLNQGTYQFELKVTDDGE